MFLLPHILIITWHCLLSLFFSLSHSDGDVMASDFNFDLCFSECCCGGVQCHMFHVGLFAFFLTFKIGLFVCFGYESSVTCDAKSIFTLLWVVFDEKSF